MNKFGAIDWSSYTPFQRKVFRIILAIPKGQVRTYGQIAAKLGGRRFARAVGQALGKNRHAPMIPCHRVVGYNRMGGYSAPGGVRAKIELLRKEGYKISNY